jgi:hypothetical protein
MKKLLSVLNPKNWLKAIIGNVIIKKVWGKFVKHISGVLSGIVVSFMFRQDVLDIIQPILDSLSSEGMTITPDSVTLFITAVVAGAFGSLWNYIEHRFLRK